MTDGAFTVEDGTLYPALHRLEREGLVSAEWGRSEAGRRAKFFNLTAAGRRRLGDLVAAWDAYVAAVARVVGHHRSHIL